MDHRPLPLIAKAGYAARGVVYFIVGGFAVVAAVGEGGSAPGTKGALMKLFATGFGATLLSLVAAGLFCHAVWRLWQSLADADRHGTDAKGLTVRGGLLVSALTHGALGVWAVSAALGSGGHRGSGGKEGFAAWLMGQPYGPWLVGAVGAAIIGAGIAHIVKGTTRGYEKWFDADEATMKLIRPVSTAGLLARGVVFLIAGGLFVYAGFTVDPDKAGGIHDALQWLHGLPYGPAVFMVIAVGLVCFGGYSLMEACWRRLGSGPAGRNA